MIDSIGRVMLYVGDPRAVADFWTQKVGFVEIGQQPGPDGTVQVEVAPTAQADTTFVLYSREMISKYEPEMSLGIPSILFSSRNLDDTHRGLQEKGVPVGEITETGGMRSFNFSDIEGNYFAVREVR
ncbi:MAG: VOC family protein [Oscillospiraceae bacterium]